MPFGPHIQFKINLGDKIEKFELTSWQVYNIPTSSLPYSSY